MYVTTDDFRGILRKVYCLIFLLSYFSEEDDSETKDFLMSKFLLCNIYRTRKRSLPRYQNTEKCVEKRGHRPSFLTTSRCFETMVKNYFEFFI